MKKLPTDFMQTSTLQIRTTHEGDVRLKIVKRWQGQYFPTNSKTTDITIMDLQRVDRRFSTKPLHKNDQQQRRLNNETATMLALHRWRKQKWTKTRIGFDLNVVLRTPL